MGFGNSYERVLSFLYRLERKGTDLKLDRMRALMRNLGNPQKRFKCVHVAGTNGKGSVCAMLSSILREAGFKAGMYTSPHLVSFNERISIEGIAISNEDVVRLFNAVRPHIETLNLTFFEVVTAMAFLYFAGNKVDFAIVEVGLGGRLDATNIIKPEVSVITNVSLEHTDFLGSTIREIAREKAGIIKRGVPVVTLAEGEALSVIRSIAGRKDSKVVIPNRTYGTSLQGEHQKLNAAIAVAAFKMLGIRTSEEMIRRALGRVSWPGRLEWIRSNVLVDCAHNPASAETLALYLRKSPSLRDGKLFVVFGCLKDKDVAGMLGPLQNVATMFVLTRPAYRRAMDVSRIAGHLQKNYFVQEKVEDAVRFAFNMASEKDTIVVTGSCYVVGEAMAALNSGMAESRTPVPAVSRRGSYARGSNGRKRSGSRRYPQQGSNRGAGAGPGRKSSGYRKNNKRRSPKNSARSFRGR